jgi:predicted esterase
MLKTASLIVFFMSLSLKVFASECIGPDKASNFVVYFHGMDTPSPSSQERANRETLLAIADQLNIRIAIPRAKEACPNDKQLICWGWNFSDPRILDASLSESAKAQSLCFPKAKKVGFIGFSNGGFVANQILKDCRKSDFSWLVSIGAAGSWNDSTKKDLSRCGHLKLMVGKKDKSNYDHSKKLASWLKDNKARVDLIEFDGGHEIPRKELEEELKKLLAEKSI